MTDARAFLRSLFDAALAAVDPRDRLAPLLPDPPDAGRLVIVGAGKAAAPMALVAAQRYGPRANGVVVAPYGYGLREGEDAGDIRILEASHPVPGADSLAAGQAVLDAVSGLQVGDRVICLLSGGGSALMEQPLPGLTLEALQALTRRLLASGATVAELNTVRKHLSAIKGGRLALAAWPARIDTFALSDVVGDDRAAIASGPTVADPTTLDAARAILQRCGVDPPPMLSKTPKPGDPRLGRSRFTLVGTPREALDGAADAARPAGLAVLDLGDRVEGEAAEVARAHAALAKAQSGPTLILSGGELTVAHSGTGRGGPNREYALSLAIALNGAAGIHALAADTDGIDGSPDAAGAYVAPGTLARAAILGLDPRSALAAHDSGPVFASLGDALVTGPTRTNVSDIRAILIERA